MSRPILIAECCQNHNGSRDVLQRMIHAAAEAGADYAKLQAIRSGELVHRDRFDDGIVDADGVQRAIKRPFDAERARLAKLDLTEDDEQWFVDECRRAGIAPMTTVFTRFKAARLSEMGFEAVKIASYDCPSLPLLREVAAEWRHVVVSTGASFDHEIDAASRVFEPGQVTFLHAITIYPTQLQQLHLSRMIWLRRFSDRVGYSDHTPPSSTGLRAAQLALALGADVVERHFTILPPDETRDGPVSVNPEQLRDLRRFADLSRAERMAELRRHWPEWETGLGNARRELGHEELLNRDYYAGRFASWVEDRQVMNWELAP